VTVPVKAEGAMTVRAPTVRSCLPPIALLGLVPLGIAKVPSLIPIIDVPFPLRKSGIPWPGLQMQH
ncbi:hypothetical protein LCGC14_2813950, partial [marine sediment metagenome]